MKKVSTKKVPLADRRTPTHRQKILTFLTEAAQNKGDYPLDAVTIDKRLGIKNNNGLYGILEKEGLIKWDSIYKGWRLA